MHTLEPRPAAAERWTKPGKSTPERPLTGISQPMCSGAVAEARSRIADYRVAEETCISGSIAVPTAERRT